MKNLSLALFLCIVGTCSGQEIWSITFRPSLHFPTRKIFNEPFRLGNGFDLSAAYTLNKNAKIYSGFTYNLFDSDEGFDEEDIALKHSGFVLGGMYFFKIFPEQKNPVYLRAGITYTSIISSSDNEIYDIKTDWSIGTQLGVGWRFEPSSNWFFLPELRYSSFSNAYRVDDTQRYLNLTHISFSIGLMYAL